MILSTVRGKGGGRLGLLSDPHTMNVALTRARHGMVVLCDTTALDEDADWSELFHHAQARGLVTREEPVLRQPVAQEAFEREQEPGVGKCCLNKLPEPPYVRAPKADCLAGACTCLNRRLGNPRSHVGARAVTELLQGFKLAIKT